MNLHHYYHVYADGVNWFNPVREHFDALHSSGLNEELTKLNVGIVGDWPNRDDVIEYIQHRMERKTWCVLVEEDDGWEQVTLNAMHKDAAIHNSDKGLALYAHTKGGAFPGEHPDAWRRVMQQKCVTEWRNVIEQMQEGQYETAGAFLIKEPIYDPSVPLFAGVHGGSAVRRMLTEMARECGDNLAWRDDLDEPQPMGERYHYSGNFWWSTLEWIRRLPYPCPNDNRWQAEMYVGKDCNGVLPRALDLEPGSPFDKLRQE